MVVDYSKFDHIDSDIDSDDEIKKTQSAPPKMSLTKKSSNGRFKYEFNGRVIYEWDQSIDEINIYIVPPEGITKHMLDIRILPTRVTVGLKNTKPFIDEELGGVVIPAESTWILDTEIQIILQKMRKAETWECALRGHDNAKIDPFSKEEERKKLMLERFQEEHPGFDFSDAEFNGQVPDAREFLGGIKYG